MNHQKNRICFAQPTKNYMSNNNAKTNSDLNSNNSLFKPADLQIGTSCEKENVISRQQSLLNEYDENVTDFDTIKNISNNNNTVNNSDIFAIDKNNNNDNFVNLIDQLMFGNFNTENYHNKSNSTNGNVIASKVANNIVQDNSKNIGASYSKISTPSNINNGPNNNKFSVSSSVYNKNSKGSVSNNLSYNLKSDNNANYGTYVSSQNQTVFGSGNRGVHFITPYNINQIQIVNNKDNKFKKINTQSMLNENKTNFNKIPGTKVSNKLSMNLEQQIKINNLRMLQFEQIRRASIKAK